MDIIRYYSTNTLLKSKDTRILLFLVEQYTIKMDITRYYNIDHK